MYVEEPFSKPMAIAYHYSTRLLMFLFYIKEKLNLA